MGTWLTVFDLAKFSVQVRGYTKDDADMVCLDIFVDFVSSSPLVLE